LAPFGFTVDVAPSSLLSYVTDVVSYALPLPTDVVTSLFPETTELIVSLCPTEIQARQLPTDVLGGLPPLPTNILSRPPLLPTDVLGSLLPQYTNILTGVAPVPTNNLSNLPLLPTDDLRIPLPIKEDLLGGLPAAVPRDVDSFPSGLAGRSADLGNELDHLSNVLEDGGNIAPISKARISRKGLLEDLGGDVYTGVGVSALIQSQLYNNI
jgi:hypothetical protein